MLVLEGSHWIALNNYLKHSSSSDYEEQFNKIYRKTELVDDKIQHDFFYSRETYLANGQGSRRSFRLTKQP